MSWITMALGLIKDVADTEEGQQFISDLRSGRGANRTAERKPPPASDPGQWREWVRGRLEVQERNIGVLVEMLNAQHETLVRIQKRQRIWNLALAAILFVAVAVPVASWLFLTA